MAGKISEMTALTAVDKADLQEVVDDPSGTPASRKATVEDVHKGLLTTGTALTAVDKADSMAGYDASATALRIFTVENLIKAINTLTAETTPATGDEVAIYDLSGTAARKMTLADALKVLNLLTAETAVANGDEVLLYDVSATAIRKMTRQNLLKNNPTSLTDGANIATDASLGDFFTVTLGGNRTLDNPTNMYDGQVVMWEFIQDGTGSRTITLGSKFAFGTDITGVTLTTTANKRDYMVCVYRGGAIDKFFVTSFIKGY